ncbi:MAG: hypothetical protein RJA78_1109 [Actinomycetota bacterium]|jgi:uncharacterized membrane protein YeaQ/YmgE (transglycosylase-associated protein family)
MELVFILVYGSILGLMAPYLLTRTESYGVLLAPAFALVYGFVAWTICTWAGLSYSDYWIWTITMLGMPAAMILGIRFLANSRVKHETA